MLGRIVKIIGVVLLIAALSGAGGVYLLHHNRNQIVSYLTGQLQQHSNIDLDIQKTSIGFRQGITFDMLGIHARSESGHFDLRSPRIHIKIELLPLLQGKIISTRAELREPEIVWHIAADGNTNSSTNGSSLRLLEQKWEIPAETLNIVFSSWHDIVCSNASIEIHPGAHKPLRFTRANLNLTRAKSDTALQADLLGQLTTAAPDETMRVRIKTRLDIPSSKHFISLADISTATSIQLNDINVAESNKYLPKDMEAIDLQGKVELDSSVKGSLAQGLKITGSMRSIGTNAKAPPFIISYNGAAIRPGDANFSGTIEYTHSQGLKISAMDIDTGLLSVKGSMTLGPDKTHADIECSSTPLSYTQLRPLLPRIPTRIKERLNGGNFTCSELHYVGPLSPPEIAGIKSSEWIIELPGLIPSEYTPDATETPQITLKQAGNEVDIASSTLEWSGNILNASAALDMQGEWDTKNKCFCATFDLSRSEARGGGIDIKTSSSPAQLRFTFHPREQGWRISAATLETPDIHASFDVEANADSDLKAQIQITQFDLNALRTRVPILDLMELGGNIDLDYSLQRQDSTWSGNGRLTLHDCSIYPALILGRIHHINGEAQINDLSINAPQLSLKLGEDSSSMQASAFIADLREPVADIHASGDKVIANDLIFNSRTALLQNLQGHIRIHADGIDFVSARVDLEQGTHAEVSGTLGFSNPDMDLDIHASYADIDEVIALWQGEGKATDAREAEQFSKGNIPEILAKNETLFIDASVDRGIFSGFRFQNATGRINIQENQLRIEPLEFLTDTGKGEGDIVVATTADPYLRISGALKHIDADKVYTQIFKDLGLLTGDLNGTFSLHGPIGPNFSANAAGTFKIDVRNGVLRQFKFLSKAFSLLNVAQLFKMQLPDMSTEGMPFKHLSADLSMEDGVLSSNNMLIRSEAMNLALAGEFSLPSMQIDATMALNPLGTVDSIFSKIPVAGWLLTGEKKAFITVEFDISGPAREPLVSMKPLSSVSNQMFGILKRALTLPGTTLKDPGKVFFHQGKTKQRTEDDR